MPISNLSNGLRTGVCTFANRPTTPYEGQVIYETDTDKVFVWNGTAWVVPNSPAQNPTGLELITACTVTSVGGTAATASGGVVTIGTSNTSVTVSSAFSTTYDNYKIVVGGGVTSATVSMNMILGANATNYYWSAVISGYGAAPTVSATSGAGIATSWRVSDASANSFHANIELQSPNLAVRATYQSMSGIATTTGYVLLTTGFLNDAAQYTAFTLSGGTMTGGTIRVYGYRNS